MADGVQNKEIAQEQKNGPCGKHAAMHVCHRVFFNPKTFYFFTHSVYLFTFIESYPFAMIVTEKQTARLSKLQAQY